MRVRPATPADAAAMLAIYRPIVEHTATSFELVPPSLDEFEARVRKYVTQWACLVAEQGGAIVGYAYAAITLPNAASVVLHRSSGFRDIGRFPSVGWKFGAWRDVGWFHRNLRAGPPPQC